MIRDLLHKFGIKRNENIVKNDDLFCYCNNGEIVCSGCNGENIKAVCAGCNGSGKRICGKCNGKCLKGFRVDIIKRLMEIKSEEGGFLSKKWMDIFFFYTERGKCERISNIDFLEVPDVDLLRLFEYVTLCRRPKKIIKI